MPRRRRRSGWRPPPLSVPQILAWADDWYERTGSWPGQYSGSIPGTLNENWRKVNNALMLGLRGLPGGSSVAKLLTEHRGVRNRMDLPDLDPENILAWADRHRQWTGEWPHTDSGPVADAPGETWMGIDIALRQGHRGLPGGSSLAQLLAKRRGARDHMRLVPLSVDKILAWADRFHRRTGRWPTPASGAVLGARGESWCGIESALQSGKRGLPGGSSIPRLLAIHRGVRNRKDVSKLTVHQILTWADSYHHRTGRWPTKNSGLIAGCPMPGETWASVEYALKAGVRGLPGGSSLWQLLRERRGVYRREHPQRRAFKAVLNFW